MRNMLIAASALAITAAGPALAQGQGKGGGNGHAQGKGNPGHPGKGKGNGNGKGNAEAGPARGNGNANKGEAKVRIEDRRAVRIEHGKDNARAGDQARDDSRRAEARADRVVRTERRPVELGAFRDGDRIRYERTGLIEGCPPGLAKKNNGCLPPGQAKKLAESRTYYSDWWRYGRDRDRGDYAYRYNDGYLYRLDPRNDGVLGYLPLLGGALSVGNVWPSTYTASPAPDYYVDYYGYGRSAYDYRYADGVMYGLDPTTNAIKQIAALLTGNDWTIGQPMPAGYSVYNVPYAYRSQYYDTPEAMYRYDDGYVYRMDPTTQLIQAAIQLIS